MNKKVKGYSSIILIIIIALFSFFIGYISLSIIQNTLILNNKVDLKQSMYITDSYSNYIISESINNHNLEQVEINENLFTDINYDINKLKINTEESDFENIPSIKYNVNSEYEKIKSYSNIIISKYNKLLFSKSDIIRKSTIEDKYRDNLEYLINSIRENGPLFSSKYTLINLSNDQIIASEGGPHIYQYTGEEFIQIKNLNINFNYLFDKNTYIGFPDGNNGVVKLKGLFYINNNINLHTDLILEGIVISDGGMITTNGYNCNINGLLLEIDDEGSFANTNPINNLSLVKSNVDRLENFIYNEVLLYTLHWQ